MSYFEPEENYDGPEAVAQLIIRKSRTPDEGEPRESLSIHVFDCYSVKDKLKAKGYKWNPEQKYWFKSKDGFEPQTAKWLNDEEAFLNSLDITLE